MMPKLHAQKNKPEPTQLVATVPQSALLSWESQVQQYPKTGTPGINYFAGELGGGRLPVDCLLMRDAAGSVTGILNRFPEDLPPYEQKGNINIFVHPDHKRLGIGTALLDNAVSRWGAINVKQQELTPEGAAFLDAYGGPRRRSNSH